MIVIMFVIVHQTHDRITENNYYPAYIISYLYPVLYPIMTLPYPAHQTGPYILQENLAWKTLKLEKNNSPRLI
jgi:hypothetical protein